jgi:hypothetical protein
MSRIVPGAEMISLSAAVGRADGRPGFLSPHHLLSPGPDGGRTMWEKETGAPLLLLGTRVEVDLGELVLSCRLQGMERSLLHLAVPSEVRRTPLLRDGLPVRLTLFHSGVCLETETTTRQWIWMRPPALVVGPVTEWRQKSRRASRAPRALSARMTMGDGTQHIVRTHDLSASGLSLLVTGTDAIPVGAAGTLTLQVDADQWCENIPFRIVRARHWLRSGGRSLELGAQVELTDDAVRRRWCDCLERLGVER